MNLISRYSRRLPVLTFTTRSAFSKDPTAAGFDFAIKLSLIEAGRVRRSIFININKDQAFESHEANRFSSLFPRVSLGTTRRAQLGFTTTSSKENSMKYKLNRLLLIALSVSFAGLPALAEVTAAGPSDPEIAHIVVTANKIDIEAGRLAKGKTKNAEVKAFAEQMITDHTAVNKQANDLAHKLKVTPKDNPTSKTLLGGAKENIANLKKIKGDEFDKAYVDHEVAYHQAVLDAIDQTLIPNAKNAELKDLIMKVRPAIDAHLGHAKMLQGKLNGIHSG